MNYSEFIESMKTPMGEESLMVLIEQKNIAAIRKRLSIAFALGIISGLVIGALIYMAQNLYILGILK
jgi:hypothetical protein